MATDTDAVSGERATPGVDRFEWIDQRLLTVCVGGLAVVGFGGLVQVSFGTFSMTSGQAWRAVFDPAVWANPGVVLSFLFGDGAVKTLGLSTSADLARETVVV